MDLFLSGEDGLVLPQTPDWAGAQRWLQNRDPQQRLRTPVLGQIALALMRRRRAQDWYASALADPSLAPEFARVTVAHFDQGGCFGLASAFQDFLHDHQGSLAPVPQRTLIIAGGADRSHRGTDFAATRELVPNSQLLHMPAVGHFPELEDSAQFVSALHQFLRA
jgi:pimeloyl-ACP methyl ester carboxylesterase